MAAKFPVKSTVILTISGIIAVGLPFLLYSLYVIDNYTVLILTMGGVNAIMAISVNTIVGITGQLSIGQAGLMAIGAYGCIFFNLDMGLPLPVAAFGGAVVAAIAGFLIGFPVLKLTGDYLAIVTLGFGEIIRVVFINLKWLTGGPNGRQFTTPMKLNNGLAFWVVTAVLVVILALLQNFLRSSYGRAIKACREDEIAADSNGINIFRYKMIGFVVAAFIAGLGGSLYAMVVGMVLPSTAQFLRSIDYLIYVVFGGMGSMTGSILAAYVLTAVQELLRFLPRILQDGRLIFYGFILILVMIFRPQGLLGTKEFSFVRTWDAFVNFLKGKIRRKEASHA